MPHDVLPIRQHIDQGPGLGPYQYAVIRPAAANICNLMTFLPVTPLWRLRCKIFGNSQNRGRSIATMNDCEWRKAAATRCMEF